MKQDVMLVAEIRSSVPLDNGHRISERKILKSAKPSDLIEAIRFVNGTAIETPTVEELLTHLFEDDAAYAGKNYTIFTRFE